MEAIKLLRICLPLLIVSKCVLGGGTMTLRMLQYVNPGGLGANGHCCDGRMGICLSACDHVFVICLDHAGEPNRSMKFCPYGRLQTEPVMNMDNIVFGASIGGTPNPVNFKFNEWPGSIYFKAKIYDYDSMGHWEYIDNLQRIISVPAAASSNEAAEIMLNVVGRTELRIGVRIHCDYGYYGHACTKFCIPRDDASGHYQCNRDGEKLCLPGWTGESCSEQVNECGPRPCQNGGHCVDLHNSFECKCIAGFEGNVCETNINDCASNPCLNNGECMDGVNFFVCLCDAGFEGDACEKMTDPCVLATCAHNGTCRTVNGTDYECLCQPDYFGENCEFPIVHTTTPIPTTTTVATTEAVATTEILATSEIVSTDSTFGTSVRVMVEKEMSKDEIERLKPWIVDRLVKYEKVNNASIQIRIRPVPCTGDGGVAVTELVLFIQYSVDGLSKDEVDILVSYISRFVVSGFPYKLYHGKDCLTGKVAQRTGDQQDWLGTNWLMVVIACLVTLTIVAIVIALLVVRSKRAKRVPNVESYACVMEPNDYEESTPKRLIVNLDLRNGTPSFNNELYTLRQTMALPSEPQDDFNGRESGFDESDYYNADAESIYQSVD